MITNENILTTGSANSQSPLLQFYSQYKNYTTVIEQRLGGPPAVGSEIICPDGTWCWDLIALPDPSPVTPPPGTFLLFINGGRIDLQSNSSQNTLAPTPIYKKPGTPFVQVLDTLQIQTGNFSGTIQFVFHRIMLKDS